MFDKLFSETQTNGGHLLDYLFFVSGGSESDEQSRITRQYPQDQNLVPDVAFFCQPEGTHVNSCEGMIKIWLIIYDSWPEYDLIFVKSFITQVEQLSIW